MMGIGFEKENQLQGISPVTDFCVSHQDSVCDFRFLCSALKDHETLKVEANNGWRIQDYQNIKGVIEDVQITFMNTSRPHLARLVALVEGKERIMVTFVSTSSANATQPFNVVPEPVPADS